MRAPSDKNQVQVIARAAHILRALEGEDAGLAQKFYGESKDFYMRVYQLDKDDAEVSFNLGALFQRGFKNYKDAIRYYQDFIAKKGISDPQHSVYKLIKECEEQIKAQEMMNAPAPTPTAEPGKDGTEGGGSADVAKDGKDGADGAKGANPEKPKADAGGPAANGGGKMTNR